jgi:FKBP-type peptidyl-prolyl cis-trans isomerase FklB
MKFARIVGLGLALLSTPPAFAADPGTLTTEQQKLSYAVGVLFGRNMSLEVEVDNEAFLQGVRDVLENQQLKLSPEEMRQVVQRYQDEQVKARGEQATRNLEAGRKFMAENAKKEGVATLPGGVQYKVVRAADGAKPTLQDTVIVHYKGTLIDGKEFDSSYRRGEPATIPLQNVIKGWQDAVTAMPVGSKWEVWVPAQLGYGEQGAGKDIEPNSTLVFEIELLEIKK